MGWWPYLENHPPTSNGISWYQKYLLCIQQHNIEYEKYKRSGCPKRNYSYSGHTNIIICADGVGGIGSHFPH